MWSIPDGRYYIPPYKATRDFIKKNYGKTIAGTKEDVPLLDLDELGRYFAKKQRSRETFRS
jgi:hypothetical protein